MNTVKGHCKVLKGEDAKDETSRSKAFHGQETMKEQWNIEFSNYFVLW